MDKTARLLLVCVLLASGCASRPVEPAAPVPSAQTEPDEPNPRNAEVFKGAGKGALGGAGVCAMPAIVGAGAGPLGFAIGAYITVVCLPFGIAIGTIAGAASASQQISAPSAPGAPVRPTEPGLNLGI
jgi:hypothetical protein